MKGKKSSEYTNDIEKHTGTRPNEEVIKKEKKQKIKQRKKDLNEYDADKYSLDESIPVHHSKDEQNIHDSDEQMVKKHKHKRKKKKPKNGEDSFVAVEDDKLEDGLKNGDYSFIAVKDKLDVDRLASYKKNQNAKGNYDLVKSSDQTRIKKKYKHGYMNFGITENTLEDIRPISNSLAPDSKTKDLSDLADESNQMTKKKRKKSKKNSNENGNCFAQMTESKLDDTCSATSNSPDRSPSLKKQSKRKRNRSEDATEVEDDDDIKRKRKKKKESALKVTVIKSGFEKRLPRESSNSDKKIDSSCKIPSTISLKKDESFNGCSESIGKKGRLFTVSIAIPISVVMETLLLEKLRTYAIGQLARAACIYSVDEIIVYDDKCWKKQSRVNEDTVEKDLGMMKMILEYQECPQYLRPCFFPRHRYLQEAGVLNPLNAPHHLRADDIGLYREGVVLDNSRGNKSYVNVGLENYVILDQKLDPGLRVTVKIPPGTEFMKKTFGYAVSPEEPRISEGLYWGYTVRVATSLSEVFKNDQYEGGYDLIIGTSDKGDDSRQANFSEFSHALIVFGGMEGLEAAIIADKSLAERDITKPKDVFPYYLNACPEQASRTIRTEEAVLIVLGSVSPQLALKGRRS